MSANLMSLARSGGKFLKLFGDRKMMKLLPYDAEVEWLQGDGVAYIDLGYGVTATTESYLDIGFYPTHLGGNGEYFAGWQFSNGSGGQWITILKTGQTKYSNGLTAYFTISPTPEDYVEMHLQSGDYHANINGERVVTKTGTTNIGYWATFFRRTDKYNSDVTKGLLSCAKLVYAKGGDGTNEFDLIPVRKGSFGYMYDRVSGKLYGNAAGTGAFVIGPDKTI